MKLPWLPPGRVRQLAGRGEIFFRHHVHTGSSGPTLLLLHGWTASADTQFFTAYQALAGSWSFIAPDHRGHGRGIRARFTLEDAADDAAALVRELGVGPVVVVGYSMGGPIAMLLAHRHPELVAGLVLEATALEWRASRRDRWRWRALGLIGASLRSRFYPRMLHASLLRLTRAHADASPWLEWLEGEVRRNDPQGIVEAGRALAEYDARPFAASIDRPVGVAVTTRDRLVAPRKQWALATATRATVVEIPADHLCPLVAPGPFAAATVELVERVVSRLPARTDGPGAADRPGPRPGPAAVRSPG
jgi:3-oxoadipate enol-lactonase